MSYLNFKIGVTEYSDYFYNLIFHLNLENPNHKTTVGKRFRKGKELPQTLKYVF